MRSIDAHEKLSSYGQMDWPNKKDSDRQREWQKLYKIAYPQKFQGAVRKVTTKELFELISGR